MEYQRSPEWRHLEPIPFKYGLGGIATSFMVFYSLQKTLKAIGPPRSLVASTWNWYNISISWIHAFLVSCWVIYCFAKYPEGLSDLIDYFNPTYYALTCFTIGYFCYDAYDVIVSHQIKKQWLVLIHHAACLSGFGYHLYICRNLSFNGIALLTELNSIFLHGRKLLQMANVSFDHWFYVLIIWMNLALFIVFRFLPIGYILYGIAELGRRLSPAHVLLLWVTMVPTAVINIGLFAKLVQSDVLRHKKPRAKQNGHKTS